MSGVNNENIQLPKKKKRRGIGFFVKVVFIVGAILFVGFIAFANTLLKDDRDMSVSNVIDNGLKSTNLLDGLFSNVQERMNFVVLGVDDDETRTDFMMVGCFNTKTKELDLVSVPRDIYVEFTDEEKQVLLDNDRFLPSKGYLKLNEVHHYAGSEMGVDFIVKKLESLLHVDFQYYVKVNLDGFRYLVDEMGGVEFNVPQRMLYEDFVQELYIDLQPGLQRLSGKEAEQLIRYRKPNEGQEKISPGYVNGDLDRVKVQQDFMKAFIVQAIHQDNFTKNLGAMLKTVDKYVTTNFNLNDITKYYKYYKDFSVANIKTFTIPYDDFEVDGYKYAYVKMNPEGTEEIISQVFYDPNDIKVAAVSSKDKKLEILNGTYTKGLAKDKQSALEDAGFDVSSIGDFSGEKRKNTYIYVKEDGLGNDLVPYFTDAKVIVDHDLEDVDIQIVLGTAEKK